MEFVDEIVSTPSPGGASNGRPSRGIINESIQVGSLLAKPDTDSRAVDESVPLARGRSGHSLSDGARKMLENLDKHGVVTDAEPEASPPDAGAPVVEARTAPPAAPAAPIPPPAPVVAAPAPAPAPDAERYERLAEHNRKLASENETLRASNGKRTLTAREKSIDEAVQMWVEDPIGAMRRIAAASLDIDDPAHADIDKQLTWAYHDMTERELSVPLDPAIKATRESERTRLMLKRERRPAEVAPAEPAADRMFAEHARLVGDHMTATKHADEYPLLAKLARDFQGMDANEAVLREIRRGFQTGEYNHKDDDAPLIAAASRALETKYQALAEKFDKARPQPSTAAPTPAPDVKASQQPLAAGHSHGPRTLTTASASVAPATPPAKRTEQPTETPAEKPKFRNEKERRKALAAKHFDQ